MEYVNYFNKYFNSRFRRMEKLLRLLKGGVFYINFERYIRSIFIFLRDIRWC